MHVNRDATSVVLDGQRTVAVYHDVDHRAVSGKRLVDGVVNYLIHEMVVAALAGVSDVHRGALAHRLHAFEDLNVFGVVVVL